MDLSSILDAAPVGTVVITPEGVVAYANAAFDALLGRSRADPAQLDFFEHVHPEDVVAVRLELGRIARGEVASWRDEHRLVHADGHPIWIMLAAAGLDRGTRFIIVQVTSIELQKRAEEALAYSESRWNFALESARQGVWDHDIRNDTMFYSRMWRVMRGIPPDEEIGRDHQDRWTSRIHPDDLPHVLATIKKQDRGDDDFEALVYRELTRDGRYIWIMSRGRPVEWDENGNSVRTLGTDTDITYLKTIEQELASEKQRLRVTLEAMADGMISADENGIITFINPAAEQLTGVPASQALGRSVSAVFHLRSEIDGRPLPCPAELCLSSGRPTRYEEECRLMSRNGLLRDVRCTATPVALPGEAGGGVVLVFQDVTQSRSLQRQLAHSAAHDQLTGLPNRAAFDRALATAIDAARTGQREHVLVYVDLDHFKPVNDTAGHAAGDALLRQVAQTIRDSCRGIDLAARIGGDEFAVILEGCSLANGRLVAEKIVRAVGALVFPWAGRDYRIGASAGITRIGRESNSPLGFMGEADAACYAAKGSGRGRVVAFEEMVRPG